MVVYKKTDFDADMSFRGSLRNNVCWYSPQAGFPSSLTIGLEINAKKKKSSSFCCTSIPKNVVDAFFCVSNIYI